MTTAGYVYSKDPQRKRFVVVYNTISELVFHCGDIEKEDILEVEINYVSRFARR